jgi:hypothetical protein
MSQRAQQAVQAASFDKRYQEDLQAVRVHHCQLDPNDPASARGVQTISLQVPKAQVVSLSLKYTAQSDRVSSSTFSSTRPADLKQHVLEQHGEGGPYVCEYW